MGLTMARDECPASSGGLNVRKGKNAGTQRWGTVVWNAGCRRLVWAAIRGPRDYAAVEFVRVLRLLLHTTEHDRGSSQIDIVRQQPALPTATRVRVRSEIVWAGGGWEGFRGSR